MIAFNTPKLAKNNTSNTLDFSNTNLQPNKEIDLLLTDESPMTVTPDAGYLGMQKVTINHPPVEELTETEITQNGEFHITPSAGYDATMGVTASVQVTGKPKTLDITKNGTYTVTGDDQPISQVTVNARVAGVDINPGVPLSGWQLNNAATFPGEYPATSIGFWFKNNTYLREIKEFDTRAVTDITDWITSCSGLHTIAKLDFSNVVTGEFGSTWSGATSLKNLGGFTGLKINVDLSGSTNLTKESILNVINEAADVTANPKTLTFGATNLAKLTDEEKAIATNKGWTLA